MNSSAVVSVIVCQWCNGMHTGICPLVKAIEYHLDGTIKRLEFKTASDYLAPQSPPNYDVTFGTHG